MFIYLYVCLYVYLSIDPAIPSDEQADLARAHEQGEEGTGAERVLEKMAKAR